MYSGRYLGTSPPSLVGFEFSPIAASGLRLLPSPLSCYPPPASVDFPCFSVVRCSMQHYSSCEWLEGLRSWWWLSPCWRRWWCQGQPPFACRRWFGGVYRSLGLCACKPPMGGIRPVVARYGLGSLFRVARSCCSLCRVTTSCGRSARLWCVWGIF